MNLKDLSGRLKGTGSQKLYDKLTVIFALFFIVPLAGFYFFAVRYNILNDRYLLVYLAVLFVFSLAAFIIIRNTFDTISDLAKRISSLSAQAAATEPTTSSGEIQTIVSSVQSLEKQLNQQFVNLDQKVAQISTLKELSDLCYVTFEAEDLLYITLERAMKLVNGDIGSVLILERARREAFIVHAAIGHGEALQIGDRINFNKSIAKFAVINKSPLLVDDIENDDRFGRKSRDRYGTKSFLCMPLKGINEVFGVLTISRRQSSQPFTLADAEVLTPLLCNAAFTYDNLAPDAGKQKTGSADRHHGPDRQDPQFPPDQERHAPSPAG